MIKNIIFDFGDIFINLNKPGTLQELSKFGITTISDEVIKIYHQYEMGLISTDEFIRFFTKKFNIKRQDLIYCWNAILLDFPKHRLTFLKQLKASKKYRLFLLSNTNHLHIKWIKNNWGNQLFTQFKNCFEQFYLSHKIKLRKPNKNIYAFVLEQNNLIAKETLFVDDTKENTETAKSLGIKTWHLQSGKEDVTELLTRKEFLI